MSGAKADDTARGPGGDAPLAPWLVDEARTLLAQRGHAFLLHGPSGLGQYELGLALVRAWLCERPRNDTSRPDGLACGACASCHAIDVRTHADLFVLMPETLQLELGWPLGEKAQEELDEKKRKPSREIRVDALRDALEFAQRTSGRGQGKAVLVFPADRMNTITANALLKTLEEPPGDTRFVLATEAVHQLLPTIRSRCLGRALPWPDTEAGLAWLGGQGVEPAAARTWLRAAGGRPAEALRLARSGRSPARWSALPRDVQRGDAGTLADGSPAEAVEDLQKLCHDLMNRQVGAPPRFFTEADLPDLPASTDTLRRLGDWARDLRREARQAEHPFNPGLMLEALVSRAQQALHSRRRPSSA